MQGKILLMKTILALETSTDVASVALMHKNEQKSVELSGVNTHSHGLIPAIADLLSSFEIELSDIELIAYGCGPGAFTGVRTACGVVQGLAFGMNIPVLAVGSLQSQAQAAYEQQGIGESICVLDARMGEVYWSHLRLVDGKWSEVKQQALSLIEDVESYALQTEVQVVHGTQLVWKDQRSGLLAMPHAKYSLSIARNAAPFEYSSPAEAQPVYLRNKVALTTSERQLAKSE